MKHVLLRLGGLFGLICLGAFLVLPPRSLYLLGLSSSLAAAALATVAPRSIRVMALPGGFLLLAHCLRFAPRPIWLAGLLVLLAATTTVIVVALRQPTRRRRAWLVTLAVMGYGAVGYWAYDIRCSVHRREANVVGPVVFLGDSLTQGIGNDEDYLFVSQLQPYFTTPLINAGRAGDMASDALRRLDRDVLAYDPRLVVVMIGGNDIIDGVPRATLEANVSSIVERLLRRNVDVVLVEVPGGAVYDRYLGMYAEIARQWGVYRIGELMLRRVFLLPFRYTVDGIHLSRDGHRLLANRFRLVLAEMYAIP